MERSDEVSKQPAVVRDILEASDIGQRASEVISDFSQRGFAFEGTLPCPPVLIIKPVAAGTRVREGSVDQSVARFAKHQLVWL